MPGNPQVENGYIRIATELWEALIQYRIPGEQRQVLDFIIRQTYGWQRKEAPISLDEFCQYTGIVKPNVCRSIRWLIDKNMIIKNDNYDIPTYCINKKYKSWKSLSKKITLSKMITKVIKNDNPHLLYKNNKDNTPISPKKKKRKTSLPDTFCLTDELREYALNRNILPAKINDLFEAFQDYHIGKNTLMADWNRAWYTWVRNAPAFSSWAVGENNNAYRELRDRLKKSGKLV